MKASNMKTNFMDDCLSGWAKIEDVHDYIEQWHNDTDTNLALNDYLGMSEAEYALFLKGDEYLQQIIETRKNNKQMGKFIITTASKSELNQSFIYFIEHPQEPTIDEIKHYLDNNAFTHNGEYHDEICVNVVNVDNLKFEKITIKSGLELISEERKRQVEQEGFDIKHDSQYDNNQLEDYAKFLLTGMKEYFPTGWDYKWFDKRFNRSHKENLIKAGALIAAQLDILNKIDK